MRKFGKMMKKKGYGARKRRDHFKNKEYVRLCYKCKSLNHVVADCPYNSDNEDNEKKKSKKDKKEKKEKKMTFKKRTRVDPMLSHGIVMPPPMMIQVMMTRHPRRRLYQTLLSTISIHYLILHHASWPRAPR